MSTHARAQELADALRSQPDDVVDAVVATLCLDVAHLAELPAPLVELVGKQAMAVAPLEGETPAALLERVRAHLAASTPSSIRILFERLVREELSAGGDRAAAVSRLLGVQKKHEPLQSGARPANTTAASPLARFLLRDDPRKKK